MQTKKQNWISITVPLGGIDIAQERRGAYEAEALASGKKLAAWCRETLDKAAKFNGKAVVEHE
jgi:hypothetical protein